MPNSIFPTADPDFVLWLKNLDDKLAGYAPTVGVPAGEVTAVHNDYVWIKFAVEQVELFKAESAERVTYKNLLRDGPIGTPVSDFPSLPTITPPTEPMSVPGIVPRLRGLVQRIKKHPTCTPAMCEDLRLVALPGALGGTPKPKGEATALPNSEVRLGFVKGTHTAVLWETERGAETTWTSLGLKMKSPFVDSRPPLVAGQPELRRYRARYQDVDELVGEYSDVMTVTTMP